jgi:hypothetical protein
MRAGLSFSRSPISLLLRQPLSIKKSYAGAIQDACNRIHGRNIRTNNNSRDARKKGMPTKFETPGTEGTSATARTPDI